MPANLAATLLNALAGVANLTGTAPDGLGTLSPEENLARIRELMEQLGYRLMQEACQAVA